jgi:predicted metal-dependent peptidase
MTDIELEKRLSAAILRLRGRSVFFATLALFASQALRDDIPTAATDGKNIFWGRAFLAKLSPSEVDAVLLHEVLHAALLHVPRRGARNPILWNIAADIVVNGMIDELGKATPGSLKLPGGAVKNPKLAPLSTEEVYEIIERDAIYIELASDWQDLLSGSGKNSHSELEAHWKQAQAQASTLSRAQSKGELPAGFAREFSALEPAQLDWRSYLWRYLVRTPTDFDAFDRRLIHRGLYVETLESESVRVFLCIDTSGSIGQTELTVFLGEVLGILRSYPHILCDLYYADAAINGPHRLTQSSTPEDFPRPVGGGGTSFVPFFEAVEALKITEAIDSAICVYCTDGFGTFPEKPPSIPTLWVVAPGGLTLKDFPFGEATRLLAREK